jgi:uncharacterized membrane protein
VLATWSWFGFWLVLHILSVIIAFGPDFVMIPFLGGKAQRTPQHAACAAEVIHVFETKVATPLAVVVPVTGVGLIYTGHVDLWNSEWLIAAIVIYIAAFFFAVTIQTRNSGRFLALLQQMPPGPPPPGAEPPAELAALGKKLQRGGMFLSSAILVILILMIGGREGWFS